METKDKNRDTNEDTNDKNYLEDDYDPEDDDIKGYIEEEEAEESREKYGIEKLCIYCGVNKVRKNKITRYCSICVAFLKRRHIQRQKRTNHDDEDITESILLYDHEPKKCAILWCTTKIRTYGRKHCALCQRKIDAIMRKKEKYCPAPFPTREVYISYRQKAKEILIKEGKKLYDSYIIELAKKLYGEKE